MTFLIPFNYFMHPMETLSKAQKDALIEELRCNIRNPIDWGRGIMLLNTAFRFAIAIVESFPTSSEGLGDPTSEPSENRWVQDASLTCNQDAPLTWIPVTEKLPVARELVLFTNSEDNWVLVGFVFYGKWYNYEDFPNPIKNGCECYPTHWQPLPPPPTN